MPKQAHFDAAALIDAVYGQRLGLGISTNHPHGFRRLLYLEARRSQRKVQVLQSPDSANLFLILKPDVQLAAAVEEATKEPSNG